MIIITGKVTGVQWQYRIFWYLTTARKSCDVKFIIESGRVKITSEYEFITSRRDIKVILIKASCGTGEWLERLSKTLKNYLIWVFCREEADRRNTDKTLVDPLQSLHYPILPTGCLTLSSAKFVNIGKGVTPYGLGSDYELRLSYLFSICGHPAWRTSVFRSNFTYARGIYDGRCIITYYCISILNLEAQIFGLVVAVEVRTLHWSLLHNQTRVMYC